MKMKTPQTHQNVWKVVKAVLGRTPEFYMLILERKNKINNLSFHLRKLEKEEQLKSRLAEIKKKQGLGYLHPAYVSILKILK